jgi:hypothetical protein
MASGIVAQISGTTVWRWLGQDALRPWRHRNYPGQIAWRDFGIATKLPFMRVSPLSGKTARIGDGLEGMTNTLAICSAL